MPYFPSNITNSIVMGDFNVTGNITISGDGYFSETGIFIDMINVITNTTNWNLWLCEDSSFNTASPASLKLVSNGISTMLFDAQVAYNPPISNAYLFFEDLNGSDTASIFIFAREL